MSMDIFFTATSPEYVAYSHLTENLASWDIDQQSLDESTVAFSASYEAFSRYLAGTDLFILPRTARELESILRRYAADAFHNWIARSRVPLSTGGYGRVQQKLEESIRHVLSIGENTVILLNLHCCPSNANLHEFGTECPARSIKTQ